MALNLLADAHPG